MSKQSSPLKNRQAAHKQRVHDTVQVGRQAILDRNLNTQAYELLYREAGHGPGRDFDGDLATSRTLLNTFIEIGLERIAGPHKIFVNLTKTFFTELPPIPFYKDRVVLEVLEDIPVDPPLIEAVRSLTEAGYQVALDDYRFESRWDPLLPFVSHIKVDITGLDLEALADHLQALKEQGLILLAEKVETQAEFELAYRLGFDLFQGYFFAKPKLVSGRRLQQNQVVILQLLAKLNNPDCTIDTLERLIAQDPSLSFKALKYINSAGLGLPRQMDSIRQAVIYIGMARIRAWVSLVIMARQTDKSAEVITTGMVRAYLCESLSRSLDTGTPESAYIVGLLSVLDTLLDMPIKELVRQLPLPDEVAQALTHQTGHYGDQIKCAIALERGNWHDPACELLPTGELNVLYINAFEQAHDALQTIM
ncbi:MAG: HDOD domain-containing protein [Gammaproteobacteria bacterium]